MQRVRKLLCFPILQQVVRRNSCNVTQLGYTANGMKVASQCTGTYLASVALSIEGGSRLEQEHNNGINNFVSHIALKGSSALPRTYIENLFYLQGGKLDIKVRRERLIFVITCLPNILCHAIELLSYVVQNTDPNMISCCKNDVFKQIDEIDKNPKKVLFDYLHASAFQGCSLGFSPVGTSESNWNLTCSDVEDYIKQFFDPMRFVIGVAGNVNHKDVHQCVEKLFSCMPGRATCEELAKKPPARYTGSMVAFRNDDMPMCHVAIAFAAPGFSNFDRYVKLLLLKEMVGSYRKGQIAGYNHPTYIGQAASIEHYCDNYEAFYFPYSDIGLFGIYFLSSAVDIDDMVLSVQHFWKELTIAPSKMDLQRAKCTLRLKLARKFADTFNNCIDMVEQAAHYPARHSLNNYNEHFHKITPKSISALCDEIIYDKCPVVAGVGPTEGIPNYTRIRAGQWSFLV